jgi:hypothetical protein
MNKLHHSKSKAANKGRRKITEGALHRLGYVPGGVIRLGQQSGIYEMMDDDGRTASFCYLKDFKEPDGIILPHPFNHYLKQHSIDLSEYQQPESEEHI